MVVVVRFSVHVHCNLGLSSRYSSRTTSVGLLHKSDGVIVVGWANEEMLHIMRCHATVCTDVKASIFLNSALLEAQESTISGF